MRFPAKQYLNHYYTEIGTENEKLMQFYANVKDRVSSNANHFEIGCGPTIYQIISIAPNIKNIIYADVSMGALRQIKYWINNEKNAFDWNIYIKRALELEGIKPSKEEILKRTRIIRNIQYKLLKRDLSSLQEFKQIGKRYGSFQSISSNFAFEAFVYKKKCI